nr:PREDICTED: alpha-1-macroglobulin-like [Latimeria chalumnae]|eukprot:XP_014339768.1 PREDICTED: alpha-1-macroglobulin-like [Latimeria chalumnae]
MKIEIAGELTEEGTGTVLTESGSIKISSVITTVTFEDTDNYYKPGIPYSGKIKLEKAGGTPLPKENIRLLVSFTVARKKIEQEYNYATDSSGRAYFTLDTSSWNQSTVSLSVRAKTKICCHQGRSVCHHFVSEEAENSRHMMSAVQRMPRHVSVLKPHGD